MLTESVPGLLRRHVMVDPRLVEPPVPGHADLPEKVLQFGTGVFLRGFTDAFIDDANRAGRFGGRVVVVGTTGSGRVEAINDQNGLYTVCLRGYERGNLVEQFRIVSSVSRALSSRESWSNVLDLARSPDIEFVVSNTTEVGIRFDAGDRLDLDPPRSFPGKLTSVLHARAVAFDHDPGAGVTVLCCELIENNGSLLRDIVLRLADRWGLSSLFADWITSSCRFCNTLVDRIVTGPPPPARRRELEALLGYRDPLLVEAEPYALWAIEGDDALRRSLPVRTDDPAIIVTGDITPFRERKVRILNGAHSVMAPLSYLCGNDTVAESMADPHVSEFVREAILAEIVPSLDVDVEEASDFARQVLERFANPFVNHELVNIALHQTTKMDVRVAPSIVSGFTKRGDLPRHLILGLAAFLVFTTRNQRAADVELPPDDRAETIRMHWAQRVDVAGFVRAVLRDPSVWSHPLAALQGLDAMLANYVEAILRDGARQTLEDFLYATNEQR